MEAKNIVSSLLTSALCIASFSTPTTNKGISHAVGYMILANIVNLYQLILWNTEPFWDLKIFCKGPRNSIWLSVIVKFNQSILQTILLYWPLYVTIVLSWIGAVLTTNKGMEFVVSLGLYVIGLRSYMAVLMYQFPMPYPSSLKNFNEFFNLFTGLRLCEEIKRDDWGKVDDDDANEDYEEGFIDDDDANKDYEEGFIDDVDGNEDYGEGFIDNDDANEDYEEGFIDDDDGNDEDYDEGFIDDDDGNEDYEEGFIDDDDANADYEVFVDDDADGNGNEDYEEGFINDDDGNEDYDESFIDDEDGNEDYDEGSIIKANEPLKEAQNGLIESEGWVVVNKIMDDY